MERDKLTLKHLIKKLSKDKLIYQFDSKNPKIRLHEPTFSSEEILSSTLTMLSGNVTMGKKVSKFENEFSKKFKIKNSVMNNSGSSANLLAISSLMSFNLKKRLKPGDEIIVPALSWSTTIWPIIQNGLVPVIVDIDPYTLNISIEGIKKSISKKTKAIMPVHVYGNPCDMNKIIEICKTNKLFLIEDSCESLGAKYKNKNVGTFGDVGTFSFYFSHHITTFEGGICITDREDLAEIIRIQRAHGWLREVKNKKTRDRYARKYPQFDERFLFADLGFNLRPTEMQASVGSIQLTKLDGFVKNRQKIAKKLSYFFSNYEKQLSIQIPTPGSEHSWFGYPIILKEKSNIKVSVIRKFFEKEGIETRPIICGNIAKQPAIKNYKYKIRTKLSNSDNIMKNGFAIPCHQYINNLGIQHIQLVFEKFLHEHSKK